MAAHKVTRQGVRDLNNLPSKPKGRKLPEPPREAFEIPPELQEEVTPLGKAPKGEE